MKTKSLLTMLGKLVHSFIYMVGCIAIWTYTIERWPVGTHVFVGATLLVFFVWYLWTFFIRPFRAALKGESQ